ncbi:hypothetical protein ACHAW5_001917 [Stephanodiscus triporus]|uniref:Uncharacterized protein n=1 Tax=Stephanodiscus triporus TaxID=2934178 RepID=A0ABD3QT91_9STRA
MMTDDGNVHLDHVLNIKIPQLSPLIEQAWGKALKSFDRACYDVSRSIVIIGYAAAAYLVMAGLSRLIEAKNKLLPPPDQ